MPNVASNIHLSAELRMAFLDLKNRVNVDSTGFKCDDTMLSLKGSHTAKTHEKRTNYAHIVFAVRSVGGSNVDRHCLLVDVRRRRFVRDFAY